MIDKTCGFSMTSSQKHKIEALTAIEQSLYSPFSPPLLLILGFSLMAWRAFVDWIVGSSHWTLVVRCTRVVVIVIGSVSSCPN